MTPLPEPKILFIKSIYDYFLISVYLTYIMLELKKIVRHLQKNFKSTPLV